jgi:hypothetical protein
MLPSCNLEMHIMPLLRAKQVAHSSFGELQILISSFVEHEIGSGNGVFGKPLVYYRRSTFSCHFSTEGGEKCDSLVRHNGSKALRKKKGLINEPFDPELASSRTSNRPWIWWRVGERTATSGTLSARCAVVAGRDCAFPFNIRTQLLVTIRQNFRPEER